MYLRKDRGTWRAIETVVEDGKRKQVTKTLKSRLKSEALAEMEEWRQELIKTRALPQDIDTPEVEDVGEHVLKYVEKRGACREIEPSTVDGYRSTAKHLQKAFPGKPWNELTLEDVRGLEADMVSRNYSPSAVVKVHKLVRQAYQEDLENGLIERNPLEGSKPPKGGKKKRGNNSLNATGLRRLVELLDTMELTNATVGARIAINTGLREAEVCALRWSDVTHREGHIEVRRSIGRTRGRTYIKDCKNDHRRDVPMTDDLCSVLTRWRSRYPHTDFILTTRGSHMSPTSLGKQWKTIAEAHGVIGTEGRVCTFHDIRHSYATVAVAANMDIKSLSSILGHSSSSITLDMYASVDPDAKLVAGNIFQEAVFG